MKTEVWNGHQIRFVEVSGEWYAVAVDICKALGLKQITRALSTVDGVTKSKVGVVTGTKGDGTPITQTVETNVIPEFGIYQLVFKSRKEEATDFDFALVLPSRRILDAFEATLAEVVLLFLAIIIHLLSAPPSVYSGKRRTQKG
ncbi:BRO family protein [Bulleidia sp. zg-1006]|nr:BRO family protein [Bulleidia sp. zg-1006]QRG86347.1 hypothetical protein JOS54_05685 [Bulleidia sp. zg-1006]